MGGDLVGDDADLHVIAVGQAEMLLGRDIAEHGGAEPADHGSADAAGDVVVAGCDIGGERPERVERRLAADGELLVHVFLDLVHRHVAGTLDHHLAILGPGDLRQFAQRLQLGELRGIVGVGDGAGPQPVAQRERHVIGAADVADLLEMLVEEAFPVMVEAPLGHDRTAAADDAGDAIDGERNVGQPHAGMDGEIVDALLRLFDQRVAEHVPGEILGNAADLFQRLVERHGADRHRRIAQDPVADVVDVAAGGEVHHRVGAPAGCPDHLFHLLGHRRGDSRIADIGVDLDQEITADDHRLGFRMVDVGRDDGAAARNLVAHELRRDVVGDRRTEALAIALQLGVRRLAAEVFANGDEFHFRRDDAGAGVSELGDGTSIPGPERLVAHREFRRQPLAGDEAIVLRLDQPTLVTLDIAARDDPFLPQARQAALDICLHVDVGVRPRRIVDRDRRLAGGRMHGDLAHRHAQAGMDDARFVDLARCRQFANGDGRGVDIHVRASSSDGDPVHAVRRKRRFAEGNTGILPDNQSRKCRPAKRSHRPYASMNWIRFNGSLRVTAVSQPLVGTPLVSLKGEPQAPFLSTGV